jgi:hypothetical protein
MKNITLSLGAWLLLAWLPLSAQIPANSLPLRIGADQAGGNAFLGQMAAVRLYDRELTAAEVKKLAAAAPEAPGKGPGIVGEWLRPSLPVSSGQKFDFPNGATLEAWVRPDEGMAGRILDQITPGARDGFLLDTYPGNSLRLIVGGDTLTHALPHSDGWTHVMATIGATPFSPPPVRPPALSTAFTQKAIP